MRVLLACEESQAVTKELRALGHEAFSCDILETSGGRPEWHIKGDVLEILNDGWDMLIGFPPCTHLAVSGARHFEEKIKDGRQKDGIDFFMALMSAPIDKIAIENPVGIMSEKYRKPDQIIQPYYFGDPYQKTTCLWLKNLDLLERTNTVEKGEMVTFSSGKKMPKWYADAKKGDGEHGHLRSKTFPGIAKAMADQWTKPRRQYTIFDAGA